MVNQDTPEPTADDGYVSRNVYDYDEPEPPADVREALAGALSNVLCNAANYPEAVAVRVLGRNMAQLIDATTDAILAALPGLGYVRIDPEDEAQVETGARSICLAQYRDPDEIGPLGVSDYGERWRGYTARARAVLAALRGGA